MSEQCPCGYPAIKYETWTGHSPLCDVEVAERERRAAWLAAVLKEKGWTMYKKY